MSTNKKSIVYVDIESLIDIRQGFLTTQTDKHDELIEYVLSDEYNYRDTDDFQKFTMVNYREAMNDPDKLYLVGGQITYILGLVAAKLNSSESLNKFNGESSVPELWLNTYPFKLTNDELEYIRDLLFVKLGRQHLIELVDMAPEELSPGLIKSQGFVAAFIYNFPDWIDEHGEALKHTQLHDCPIHFAPVYRERPSKEELKQVNKTGFSDPFNYMECIMSPLIKAIFLPMVFYSNVLVASKHVEEYHGKIKKRISEESQEIEIPEEMLKDVDLGQKV